MVRKLIVVLTLILFVIIIKKLLLLQTEIEVVVSSSSSLNHNHNHHLNNIGNLKPSLKHEFLKLADSFDRKFNELDEIRNQLRVLIDEMSSNF